MELLISNLKNTGKKVSGLLGPNIIIMFALTVPVGLAAGAGEILFGVALYDLLVYFNIVSPQAAPGLSVSFSDLGNPVTVIIVLAIGVTVLRFLGITLPSFAAEALATRIRTSITDSVLEGAEERAGLSVSDVSHVLSNLSPNTAGFLFSVARVVVDVCFLAIILLGLASLSPVLTAITLALSVVIGAPMVLTRGTFSSYSQIMHEDSRFFTHRIIKDVKNIHFLKVTGTNEGERTKITGVSQRIFRNVIRFRLLAGVYSVLPQFLGVVSGVIVIFANQELGFVALSALVPFMYLLTRITGAISSLTSTVAQLQASLPFAVELLAYADLLKPCEEDTRDKTETIKNLSDLQVDGLNVGRTTSLLSDLSFSVSRGQMLLISGASGQGKTTLLMTLIGLIRRLDGHISWNGVSLDVLKTENLRQSVGYAGPDPYLVNGTVRDNILFGVEDNGLTESDIQQALWCAKAEFVNDIEEGIYHQLREDGDGVSAGQKQRLALARALLRMPDLLLLDEATANIDEEMEEEIMKRIRKTFPEMIIVAVSHRSSMKKFATQQLIIGNDKEK